MFVGEEEVPEKGEVTVVMDVREKTFGFCGVCCARRELSGGSICFDNNRVFGFRALFSFGHCDVWCRKCRELGDEEGKRFL